MNANNDTSETWTASEYHDPPVFLDFTPLRLFITVLNILNLAISLYFLHQHFIFRRKARRGNNSYNYSRDSNASKRHYAPFCLTFQSKFTTQRLLFFSISVIIFLSLSFLFAQHIARYALFLEADSVVVNALNIGYGFFFAGIALVLISTLYRYRRLLMVLNNSRDYVALRIIEIISILLGVFSFIIAILPYSQTPPWTVYINGTLVLWSSVIECVLNMRMILVTLASEKMPTPKSSNNMSSPQSSSFSVVKMGKSIKSIMVSIPSLDRSRKNSAISLNLQHQQSPPNSPTSPLKPIIGAQKIEISTSTHQLPITLPAKEAEQSNYNVQSNGSAASILLASARERLKKNEHVRTGSLELCNHSSGYSLQPRSTNGRMVAATAQATNLGAVVMVRSPLKNVTTKLPHSDSTSLNLNASAGELYSYASSNLVNEFNEQDLHAVTRPQKPLVSLHKLSIERRLSFKQNVLNSPTTDPDLASTLVALSKKQEKQKRLQRLKIQLATWYVAQMTAALIVLSLYLATSITPSLAYYQQDVTELTVMFGCFDIWFCLTMLNRFRSGVLASVKPAPAPADTAAAGQGVSTSARQATVQTIGIQFLSQLFRFCKRLLCIKYEKGESECEGRESIVTSLSEVSSWREEEQGERDGIRQGEVIRFASEHAFVEETSLWAMNKDDDSDD